ncbi:LytR/AlgR family response regulator transcription factor [Culturomica massiliensis]|jgi:DNA-binding LytR/AlgR family response regulator|uniref:LytR/AlgR family response regulator transcription factor n=1 Tax=Culturomica massiliensis TaxID=1841857 RepID=UPI000E55F4D9|nr:MULTISPECIES: LytTR family DNA-binding domain-containing protein [Odoribacteraceae]RHV91446.1 DNA-binding response regulator [Odoribacter sp. OF09-27XD]
MKAVIVEDERAAVRNLTALLTDVTPEMEVIAVLDSISESVEWFKEHKSPDLVFMDIHLADGSAFEIFRHIEIACPVIFTTAYDEYALKAFKVNSVDYLLKPIGAEDVRNALKKLELFRTATGEPESGEDIQGLIRMLRRQESYKTHFLVPQKGDKLLPLSVESVYYFYINEGIVKAVTMEGKEYPVSHTLDEIADSLNPIRFFRVNRQYLIARKAIKDIDLWFNGRLSVNLIVPVPEKILISRVRVAEFKEWFVHGE